MSKRKALPLIILAVVLCLSLGLVFQTRAKATGLRGSTQAKCTSDQEVQPPASGYGAPGNYGATEAPTFTLDKNGDGNADIFIWTPDGLAPPYPTVFFAHGTGAGEPEELLPYSKFIQHVVSRGVAFVYPTYAWNAQADPKYAALTEGFALAVESYPELFDLSRVGFVGHSYGGGAIPAVSYHFFREVDLPWGSNGRFAFLMAPSFPLNFRAIFENGYPTDVKLLIAVYDKDYITSEWPAEAIYWEATQLGIPVTERDWVRLISEVHGNCRQQANHVTPTNMTTNFYKESGVHGLDYYGVYRLFDALADYALNGNHNGQQTALGHGNATQTYMGVWPNGEPTKPLVSLDPLP